MDNTMNYDHGLSIANIHNVVVALNQGGMLTCDNLMNRLWDDATTAQRDRKVSASRSEANHTEAFARKQIRQEIRRSLYMHFNDPEALGFHISRAHPLGDVEFFWVVEVQTVSPEEVSEEVSEEIVDTALIYRLLAANTSSDKTSDLVRHIAYEEPSDIVIPEGLQNTLTEGIRSSVDIMDPYGSRSRISSIVASIITELESEGL